MKALKFGAGRRRFYANEPCDFISKVEEAMNKLEKLLQLSDNYIITRGKQKILNLRIRKIQNIA